MQAYGGYMDVGESGKRPQAQSPAVAPIACLNPRWTLVEKGIRSMLKCAGCVKGFNGLGVGPSLLKLSMHYLSLCV
jgi:hypothetical protein